MKKISVLIIGMAVLISTLILLQADGNSTQPSSRVSGALVNGYRVLPIPNTDTPIQLTVFRGDYVKFDYKGPESDPMLSIPELSINQKLSNPLDKAPYFKMKTPGTFSFSLGDVKGDIHVIAYQQVRYKEVSSKDAAGLIKNIRPLILDVRTPAEYNRFHLKDAKLIPVQQLYGRLKELSEYKDQNILIYCATGNRSTVASKILIDNGFNRIYNMRYGITDWSKNKYPVIKSPGN